MGRTTYPTAADLASFLRAADITVDNDYLVSLGPAVAAARAEFERDTGRTMLAGSTAVRRFDPPTNPEGLIFLPYDLASITSIVYYPTGGTSTTFDATEEYDPEPYNASAVSKPYTRIRIYNHRWMHPLNYANRNSIRIDGRWGYATTVPDDAWLAILARAAWSMSGVTAMMVSGGIDSWTDGDRRVQYGGAAKAPSPLLQLRESWCGEDGQGGIYGRVVNLFRRWDI